MNKAANEILRGGTRSSGGGTRWVHRTALGSGAGTCKMSRLASLRLPLQVGLIGTLGEGLATQFLYLRCKSLVVSCFADEVQDNLAWMCLFL